MEIEKIYLYGYQDFLKKNLKTYNYIKDQYGFNISILKMEKKKYIIAVRYLGTIQSYFGEPVIPGNFSNINGPIVWKYPNGKENKIKSVGKNFFWNVWYKNLIDNTIFFVGNVHVNGKIDVYEEYGYDVIMNETVKDKITMGDIRLFRSDNKYYYYDSYISRIAEIYFIDNKIKVTFNYNKFFNTKICKSGSYIKQYDKNWSFMSMNKKSINFLYWYLKDGVYQIKVSLKDDTCVLDKLYNFNNGVLPNLGSNEFPMSSFSTPTLKINKNLSFGCGYVKFCLSNAAYNEKINNFIDNLQQKLLKLGNYVEHFSYMYVPYLFKIENDKFYISNPFFVINNQKKYNFSIIYPMSVFKKKENIFISAGEGDFYTIMLKLTLDNFKKYCIHDIQNFNLSDINFEIIENLS